MPNANDNDSRREEAVSGKDKVKQDRPPNFRDEDGNLFLVRCFKCAPDKGRENYMPSVASGQCAWCGWKEKK